MPDVTTDGTRGTAAGAEPGPPGSGGASSAPVTVAIAALVLVLYLGTLSKHYSEGEDSASYVIAASRPVRPVQVVHPNHLAYIGSNRLVYALARAAGYSGDPSLPMKVVSAVSGALALAIMMMIMRRLGVDGRLASTWAVITALCYGYWSYSTQAETYTLPLPFLLLGVLTVVQLGDGPFSTGAFAGLGVYNALTTLFQQMHIINYPLMIIAVVAIWYRRRQEVPAARLVTGLMVFSAVSAAIVGGAYFAAALGPMGLRDLSAIITWSKGHGNEGPFSPVRWTNPLVSLIAIGHTIIGGHFLFGFDGFYEAFVRRFPHKLLIEERYLAVQLPVFLRLACVAASVTVIVSGLAFLAPVLTARQRRNPEGVPPMRIFAANVIVWPMLGFAFVFNTIMEPTTIEWWVAPLPLAAIGLASLQARRPSCRGRWVAGAFLAVSLLVANGAGSIIPQSDLRADYWYQANAFLIRTARPGDVILTDGGFISDSYLKLYTGATVLSVHQLPPAELERVVTGPHTGRVWVSSWAFEPLEEVRRTGYLTDIPTGVDAKANQARLKQLVAQRVPRDAAAMQSIWELTTP